MKWLTLLMFPILLLSACHKKAAKTAPLPPAVHAKLAEQKDAPITIETFGLLQPSLAAEIRPQVTGKILKRLFEEGAVVQKEELLYIIDPAEFEARVHNAEAAQKKAEAELVYAREVLRRNEELAAREYISQLDFEKFQQNIAVANATLNATAAQLEQAQIELGYCYIKAPFTGRISYNTEDPGSIVSKDKTVLTQLLKTDSLKVEFNITDLEFERVQRYRQNAPLYCQVASRGTPKTRGTGLLTAADNTINTKTGTIRLQAVIDNEQSTFWPGQYVDASLVLYVEKDAVVVPASACVIDGTHNYAYIIENHIAKKVPIEIKDKNAERAIISKGIQGGDLVITDGQFNVSSGRPVRVVKEKSSS